MLVSWRDGFRCNSRALRFLSNPRVASGRRYSSAPVRGQEFPPPSSRLKSEEHFLQLLSQCNRSGEFNRGICFHSSIIKLNLLHDLVINNTLISIYCKLYKYGGIWDARKLFDELGDRDVVSWTIVMSAHAKAGEQGKSLDLFEEMISSGSAIPNAFTLSCVLQSCAALGETTLGLRAHAYMVKLGLLANEVLLSALADFYSKAGMAGDAQTAFSEIFPQGDAILWTTIISCLLREGLWVQALEIFAQMSTPNEFTFSSLLSASLDLGLGFGEAIHGRILSSGVDVTLILKTSLVDMYCKHLRMTEAQKVFDESPHADCTLWTALISGYLQDSDYQQVINKFFLMEAAAIPLSPFTYAAILSACSSLPSINLGIQFHCRLMKKNLDSNSSVGNSLMDLYSKWSSAMKESLVVFSAIKLPNVISWTILISSLVLHHRLDQALYALAEMQVSGIQPNSFTLSAILNGFENKSSYLQVQKLHAFVLKNRCRFLSDSSAWNSLLDAYIRLGKSDQDFWKIFHEIPCKDAISFTNFTSGLNKRGFHGKTLDLIFSLREESVDMDSFLLPCFLSAAAGLAAIEAGRQLHGYSIKSNLSSKTSTANALINLYGKCGDVAGSRTIFASLKNPNLVSWNGFIGALSSNGFFSEALSCFENFRVLGIKPDSVTLLLLLYACSHSGLTDLGLHYFDAMRDLHELDHYVCAVDLLGRSGRLEEASALILEMPFEPDALIYKTLLSGCRLGKNLELGEFAAARALELDPSDPTIYVLLSRMYADAGKIKLAEEMMAEMKKRGIKKDIGRSWVEIRNRLHCFTARDGLNPELEVLHGFLEELEKKIGFLSNREGRFLNSHSERLALAFGVMNSAHGGPLRVIKNLRICIDCHEFMSLASKEMKREIVVRDGNRYHSFKDGICSCRGFW